MTVEDVKSLLEIILPIVALVAWFVRLEYKVLSHDKAFTDIKEQTLDMAKASSEDRVVMQKIAVDIREIKTNLEWMVPLFKDKLK